MSADNFIGILKCKDGKYRGYMCSASTEYDKEVLDEMEENDNEMFVADTEEEAWQYAWEEEEDGYYEYGVSLLKEWMENNAEADY